MEIRINENKSSFVELLETKLNTILNCEDGLYGLKYLASKMAEIIFSSYFWGINPLPKMRKLFPNIIFLFSGDNINQIPDGWYVEVQPNYDNYKTKNIDGGILSIYPAGTIDPSEDWIIEVTY